jgi:hypothetical protein
MRPIGTTKHLEKRYNQEFHEEVAQERFSYQ